MSSPCTTCNDKILNPSPIQQSSYCIECIGENNTCGQKFPSECVIYHLDTDAPSQLINLGIPNKKSVSYILEEIDKLIGNNFNTPIVANSTNTVLLTANGISKHTIRADVKLSQDLGNLIELKTDGLFVGTAGLGKVKVNSTDPLAYLEEQIIGGTDGIVSISTPTVTGLLNILPSLNVENLLTDIRLNHLNTFNQLLSVSHIVTTVNNSIQSKLAPFVAYPYHGSLANFDATGRGLIANGYDKIFICNGANGTPDYRGRSPIGANVGVPGGALDASVNPAITGNIGVSVNQKTGAYTHTLVEQEIAAHTHTINDPGHFHYTVVNGGDQGYLNGDNIKSISWNSEHHNGNQDYDLVGNSATPTLGRTDSKATGITINDNVGDAAHNNTHPVIGTVFIMYIP